MLSDFLKKPLAAGDTVVFIETGYREFTLGTVNRVLPQKVEVAFNRHGRTDYTFRFPEDVVHV